MSYPYNGEDVNVNVIGTDPLTLKKRTGCGGFVDALRSVTFLFGFLIVAATVTCAVSVWFVYTNASNGPINDMSESIRNLTMASVATFAQNFFDERQAAVDQLALAIADGAAPQMIPDSPAFDVVNSNNLVWSVIMTTPDVWIFNAMTAIDVCFGYSKQDTNTSYGWFGSDGNTTLDHYQSRRFAPQVDQITGWVNYSLPATWQSPGKLGTLWPTVYNSSWGEIYASNYSFFSSLYLSDCGNTGDITVLVSAYYYPSSGTSPAVDNYFPEYGIQYTYIRPFVVRETGVGGIASCTFNTRKLLDWTKALDLLGGVLYLTTCDGYITASSLDTLPVYGPNGASPPLPQTNGTILPYGQYNYTNFPNQVVQVTGATLARKFDGFTSVPDLVATLHVSVGGTGYSVSTQSFETNGLIVRVVLAIPESSFVGFTATARRNTAISVAAVVVGFCIVSALASYFLVSRHIAATTDAMYESVSEEGMNSILHQDHVEWEYGSANSDSTSDPLATSRFGRSSSDGGGSGSGGGVAAAGGHGGAVSGIKYRGSKGSHVSSSPSPSPLGVRRRQGKSGDRRNSSVSRNDVENGVLDIAGDDADHRG